MKLTNRLGLFLLILFMLPFCAIGLFFMALALQEVFSEQPDIGKALFLGLFGLVFGGIGFWVIFRAFRNSRSSDQVDQQKVRYPNEPWLWCEEWATKRIKDSNRSSLRFAWFFALFWNLVSTPLLFVLPEEILEKKNYPALLGLLFPVVGAGLLVWAIRATLRWRKFGTSVLELQTLPGVIGGHLKGVIRTASALVPDQGLLLTLTCVNRVVSGSGKDSNVHEKILLREKQVIPRETIEALQRGSAIPFRFDVPYQAKDTNRENMDNAILWYLQATASVPGVDYSAQFEVPIFKTENSDPNFEPSSKAEVQELLARELTQLESHQGISVRPSRRGGTEFYFGPARNVGLATGLTVFTLIWSGIIWFMITQNVPIFFSILFILFALLLLYAVLHLWLGVSKVLIESGQVTVTSGLLWLGLPKRIPCALVEDVKISIGMQSGGRSGTPYYDIKIIKTGNKKVTAGRHIRDKGQAEWLVKTMNDAINQWR